MALQYIFLTILIQVSLIPAIYGENDVSGPREILKNKIESNDDVIKDCDTKKTDWMDMFLKPDSIFSSPSASMMAQVTNSDKSPEEQLKIIKEMANKITMGIQSEMANLLAYALVNSSKNTEENKARKTRSVETPMDSTQLIMRLLKHIKNNNEYQNIAIEKMMSAQEIADKYGIEFNPDPEILLNFAVVSNEQAKDLTSILDDTCKGKNKEETMFVPIEETNPLHKSVENNTSYYLYDIHYPENINNKKNKTSLYEHIQETFNIKPTVSHVHYPEMHPHNNYYYDYPYENQIFAPPTETHQHHCNAPVSKKINFYDFFEPITPAADCYNIPYCSMEPTSSNDCSTVVHPFEEQAKPEPELVGEEFEETISNKVYIDHEEPNASTVNHVMTYTISEKSRFKTPEIEKLPEQVSGCGSQCCRGLKTAQICNSFWEFPVCALCC